MNKCVCSIGETLLTTGSEVEYQNQSPYQLIHNNSHMNWTQTDPVPS